jgi:hypothetical protein
MKRILIAMIVLFLSINLFAQSNCEKRFDGMDLLRWRKETGFIPKYTTIEEMEYIMNSLSARALQQLQIEARVACGDYDTNKKFLRDFSWFYDNRISNDQVQRNIHAYYVFYTIDKTGYSEYLKAKGAGRNPKTYPSEKNYSQSSINLEPFYMQTKPENCGCFLKESKSANSFYLVKNDFDVQNGGMYWIKNNGYIASLPLVRTNETLDSWKYFFQEFNGKGYNVLINYSIADKQSPGSFISYNTSLTITNNGITKTYKLYGKCGCAE